jgi:ribosome-associated toxin RatA of RatAB toxin-antitoxin module
MHTLKRQAIVPYSAEQMFALVNNVADYPRFLPWCHTSTILSSSDTDIVASLEVVWKGIHKNFTTRNVLTPHSQTKIELVNGPLQHLDGLWQFQPLNDRACKIILDLEFEFTGRFIDKLFQPIFQHIANTLVDAFCKRAVELYGSK